MARTERQEIERQIQYHTGIQKNARSLMADIDSRVEAAEKSIAFAKGRLLQLHKDCETAPQRIKDQEPRIAELQKRINMLDGAGTHAEKSALEKYLEQVRKVEMLELDLEEDMERAARREVTGTL